MDQKPAMGNACGDDHSSNNTLKSTSWSHNNKTINNEKLENMVKSWEYPYGYPWPPRYYKCSFCSREFKSSQALGGHMNVHRRERAKLRSDQSLPPSNPNPNPINPRFSSSSSLATTSIYTHQYSLVSLSLSSLSSLSSSSYLGNGVNPYSMASTYDNNLGLGSSFHVSSSNLKSSFSFKDISSDRDEDKDNDGVKLDLELGLIKDTKEVVHDLDLELRLGMQKPS